MLANIVFASSNWPLFLVVGLLVGIVVGGICVRIIPFLGYKNALKKNDNILKDAEIKANQIVKSAQIEGRAAALELKVAADKEIKEKKDQILEIEKKIVQREQAIDVRDLMVRGKEESLEEQTQQLEKKAKELNKQKEGLDEKINSIIVELEKVAGMTSSEAKKELFKRVEEKSAHEIAAYLKEREEAAKETADENAREVLAVAVEKYSQEVASERTVSVVALPSDEMKGRIIGREGRNIKTIEQLTGVDLIIDDTPEVITVSCFDPIRREIARRSLEALIIAWSDRYAKGGSIYIRRIVAIVGIIGEQMIVTLVLMFIAIAITKWIQFQLLDRVHNYRNLNILTLILVVISYVIFALLTFYPPRASLFRDPQNDTYGITEKR